MGRKNAAVWGNSRISEDDELKLINKLERVDKRQNLFSSPQRIYYKQIQGKYLKDAQMLGI